MRRVILVAANHQQGIQFVVEQQMSPFQCGIITEDKDTEKLKGLEKNIVLLLPGYERNFNLKLFHNFLRARRFNVFEIVP